MFVYQPTFNNADIKQENNKYNVFAWKSKGIYISDLSLLYDLAPLWTQK